MSFGNLDPNATGNFTLQQVKAKKKGIYTTFDVSGEWQ